MSNTEVLSREIASAVIRELHGQHAMQSDVDAAAEIVGEKIRQVVPQILHDINDQGYVLVTETGGEVGVEEAVRVLRNALAQIGATDDP